MIADFVEAFLPRLNARYGKALTIDDIVHYDFAEVLQVGREEMDNFFARVRNEGIYRDLQVIDGAREALSLLSRDHSIRLITFRVPQLRSDTEHWLRKNDIPFDEVTYLGYRDKAEHVSDCDVFIEDSLDAAVRVAAKGVDVLLFDYPWNRRLDRYSGRYPGNVLARVRRVSDWSEIMEFMERREALEPVHCKGGVREDG